jgi:hypothetical protein
MLNALRENSCDVIVELPLLLLRLLTASLMLLLAVPAPFAIPVNSLSIAAAP